MQRESGLALLSGGTNWEVKHAQLKQAVPVTVAGQDPRNCDCDCHVPRLKCGYPAPRGSSDHRRSLCKDSVQVQRG